MGIQIANQTDLSKMQVNFKTKLIKIYYYLNTNEIPGELSCGNMQDWNILGSFLEILGDLLEISYVQLYISVVCCTHLWYIKLNAQRQIPNIILYLFNGDSFIGISLVPRIDTLRNTKFWECYQ